jgi:hypothetical protein
VQKQQDSGNKENCSSGDKRHGVSAVNISPLTLDSSTAFIHCGTRHSAALVFENSEAG